MDNTEGKTKTFIQIWQILEIHLYAFPIFRKGGKYYGWNSVDKTGQKFNMLTAIERLPNLKGNGKTYSCGCVNKQVLSQRKDYTGQRFNNLTVTKMLYNYKYNKTYCKCTCDCGNETITYMGNIKLGKTKSCGCIETSSRFGRKNHEKDLVGKQFGHLTVIKLTDKRYDNGNVGWLCECDCGNQTIVRSGNLLRGKTRSCGCNKTSKYEECVEDIVAPTRKTGG